MKIRDQELKRLVKYAEGMGLIVKFLKSTSSGAADWTLDGTEIRIYDKDNTSKIEMVLSVIHELGHHVWFIHQKNRQPDLKFEQAIEVENLYQDKERSTPAPKDLRKKILNVEIAGTKWWEVIYKDTNMQFPMWMLHKAMEYDIWQYEYYYRTGKFPNRPLRRKKRKLLRLKYMPRK